MILRRSHTPQWKYNEAADSKSPPLVRRRLIFTALLSFGQIQGYRQSGAIIRSAFFSPPRRRAGSLSSASGERARGAPGLSQIKLRSVAVITTAVTLSRPEDLTDAPLPSRLVCLQRHTISHSRSGADIASSAAVAASHSLCRAPDRRGHQNVHRSAAHVPTLTALSGACMQIRRPMQIRRGGCPVA